MTGRTPTSLPDVGAAAAENAAWCDAVCSAHGSPGRLAGSHWLTTGAAPPFYPNLVTLVPAPGPALQAIRALVASPPSDSWSVKDSFAALALGDAGFRLLFEAQWIARPAGVRHSDATPSPGVWRRVETEHELAAWELAWGESRGRPRIFLPALLRRDDVAILAATRDDAIVAGIVAHRVASLVGISNLFAHGDRATGLWSAALGAASDAFPGLPLVGYETGRALDEARARGFSALGPLRVWLREE